MFAYVVIKMFASYLACIIDLKQTVHTFSVVAQYTYTVYIYSIWKLKTRRPLVGPLLIKQK